MVFEPRKPIILVEIRNAIHLVALSGFHGVNDGLGILWELGGERSQEIKVHPGVVQVRGPLHELCLVIETINLSRLSVCSECLLLNLIGGLNKSFLMISLSECNM